MANRSLTLKKKVEIEAKFLERLRETCNVGASARYAGVRRETIWQWRQKDVSFDEQCQRAKAEALEALEDEVHRRAFQGTTVLTKQGEFKKYSDILAIFLLKAHAPEKYRDNMRVQIASSDIGNLSNEEVAIKLDQILKGALERKNENGN